MDKKGFLKRSFHIITHFSITCLIILLFFLSVSHFIIHVSHSQAQDLLQSMLTGPMCQEIQAGILVDDFEYWAGTSFYTMESMGWIPIDPVYSCGCFLRHYFHINNVLDFEEGSRVLDAYTFSTTFLIEMLKGTPFAIMKKTAYTDLNGYTHNSIPAHFPMLNFEVRSPLAIEQFNFFKFEVEVQTNNTGYAKIVIILNDKSECAPSVNALETVEENVEIISNDQANPSIIKMYLGSKYMDGKWHHVEVNLNAAIKRYSSSDEELAEILSVIVWGNQYRLDDIVFFKSSKSAITNHAPDLFHVGPVYCQLYGQQGYNTQGRWIFAEDLDLGLTSERTTDGSLFFPHIADDADGDGIPTALHINPDETIENQADITESTLAIYHLEPNGKPNLASPQTPADADLTWILTMGDTLGPIIADGFIEVADINLDSDGTISSDEMNTWPPYLIQRNGVFIENKEETDPIVIEATGTPYVMDLSNPMYALACALLNSGYDVSPNARKIAPNLGLVFEDMIVTFRVSDGMATDKETFPVSVVNYPVTNNPPIFDDVADQVFEVGKTNYYQTVVHDPDLEDMINGLTYYCTLNGLPSHLYGPSESPINQNRPYHF